MWHFQNGKKVDEEPLCNFFNFEKESCLKTLLLWLNEGGSVSNFHTEIGIFLRMRNTQLLGSQIGIY